MMDALVKTLLCINFLCIIWYFLRDTVKENAKKYDFKHTFGVEKTFWALIPNLNLNFSQGFAFEIEILCFHYYFDVTKKKDFSEAFDSINNDLESNSFFRSISDKWLFITPPSVSEGLQMDAVIFNTGHDVQYGFDHHGNFTNEYCMFRIDPGRMSICPEIIVRDRLLKELSKRGIYKGTILKCIYTDTNITFAGAYFDTVDRFVLKNKGMGVIYANGKWAEIVNKNEGKTN